MADQFDPSDFNNLWRMGAENYQNMLSGGRKSNLPSQGDLSAWNAISPEYQAIGPKQTYGYNAPQFGQEYMNKAEQGTPASLGQYRSLANESMKNELSPWFDLQRKGLMDQATRQREALARGQQGQTATAMSQLASKGGLVGGERERLQQAMGRQAMLGRQAIGAQEAEGVTGLMSQDVARRQGSRERLIPGLYGAEEDARKTSLNMWAQGRGMEEQNRRADIMAMQGQNQNLNAFNMDRFKGGMSAWAANRQADAMANAAMNS